MGKERPPLAVTPLPVMQPRLPTADAFLTYLRDIDASGFYSNYGPLLTLFAERLAAHFDSAPRTVLPVASGTAGLSIALMAAGAPRGSLCLMPAWTFVATGHAALAAGLTPSFVDVSPENWALTPELANQALQAADGPVGAVVIASPFGAPVDPAPWEAFQESTGLPVIIDAAAAFDTARPSGVPTVVSLHATKVFGVGEGGLVLHQDPDFIDEVQRRGNFGFFKERVSRDTALNAKMSEYHAAVGLAALDAWPDTRAHMAYICGSLRTALAQQGITFLDGFGQHWVASTCTVRFTANGEIATKLRRGLRSLGIESRHWWGYGLHREPAFEGCPRGDLTVTDDLARSVLGLPCFPAMTRDQIDLLAKSVATQLG
ncbi:MAG: DegT/DnrJ/EryC1/StrS family aminotransferase [Magnetospiraceae bacterium]